MFILGEGPQAVVVGKVTQDVAKLCSSREYEDNDLGKGGPGNNVEAVLAHSSE